MLLVSEFFFHFHQNVTRSNRWVLESFLSTFDKETIINLFFPLTLLVLRLQSWYKSHFLCHTCWMLILRTITGHKHQSHNKMTFPIICQKQSILFYFKYLVSPNSIPINPNGAGILDVAWLRGGTINQPK